MSATLMVVPTGKPADFTLTSLPPAKSQCGNGEQIVRRAQLARGMALERQQRIVMGHPVTIIDHANHALAADLHFDTNRLRTCVDGILQELFHHRRRQYTYP